jgi:hypothetical protein
MKKNTSIGIVVGVIVAVALFYGGVKYGEAKGGRMGMTNRTAQFGQGQMPNGTFNRSTGGAQMAARNGGGVMGEILSKDATTVTVKLPTGGSKIVFTSASTTVFKTAAGSLNDLEIGQTISVQGSTNSDGSVTAQSIQLRPTITPQKMN